MPQPDEFICLGKPLHDANCKYMRPAHIHSLMYLQIASTEIIWKIRASSNGTIYMWNIQLIQTPNDAGIILNIRPNQLEMYCYQNKKK